MSMVQPIAQPIPAFDAKNDNTFTFVSVGGNQVIANRLVIRENITNRVIYDKRIETYKFEHTVKANTLQNGIYYNFYFITYDVSNNESPKSNTISFICYNSPTIEIINIPFNNIINGSNYTFKIRYNQAQGELMDSAKFILLDSLGNKLLESSNIYNTNIPPIEFNYELKGLNNDTTYMVYVIASTVNKTIIESEKYTITSRYATPAFSTLLELSNNCNEGYIQLKNNFVLIESDSNPKDISSYPQYFYDGKVDLREKGTYLKYAQGFNIYDDFTLRLFVEKPNLGELVTLSNNKDKIVISLTEDYPYNSDVKSYCGELTSSNLNNNYFIYSNYLRSKDNLMIWVRRVNNLFEIKLENLNKEDNAIYWNTPTNLKWNTPTNIFWGES